MIYISGRITRNKNWKEQFQQAEDFLTFVSHDDIVNPLQLDKETQGVYGANPTYAQYMLTDISKLIYCDKIYMLCGWWRSRGARLERRIAKVLGMKVIYQKRSDK